MIHQTPDGEKTAAPEGERRWAQWALLGIACTLVIGIYARSARLGLLESLISKPADSYYNLLVQGFRAGQLNLKTEAPQGLAQLANPYDPNGDLPYLWLDRHPLHDLSYYRGKLYLYFGVTPALMLFWPYAALTGYYLLHKDAVVIFFSVGFLASVGLLRAVWRRYFAEVSVWTVVAGTLALGLANFTPAILSESDVWEVPISCGNAMTMLALVGIWKALHDPSRRGWWLAAASLAYGLAVGARPSLLFGAAILLVPVLQAWNERFPIQIRPWTSEVDPGGARHSVRDVSGPEQALLHSRRAGDCVPHLENRGKRRQVWVALLAAIGPVALIGLGLLLYNLLRFDNPFEFGQHYQLPLPPSLQGRARQFSLSYLWFNFRVAFLAPARWNAHFPFVHEIPLPPLPAGGDAENPFGILTNIPLVWLALAAPLAWRSQVAEVRAALRWFLVAVVLLFGACALTLVLHNSMCLRYEVEFAHALVFLAVVGILGLERALANRLFWRRVVRWGWGLFLCFSLTFDLLASFARQAEDNVNRGFALFLLQKGQLDEAIAHLQRILEIWPDMAPAHNDLAVALVQKGRTDEAIARFQKALELQPNYAEAHNNLGMALLGEGRLDEAMVHLRKALEIQPDYAHAHFNLGNALYQQGRLDEARVHFLKALEAQPDYAEAHNNLGSTLLRKGRLEEAIDQYRQALRLKPEFTGASNNLITALGMKEASAKQPATSLKP